jgi:hypothetical protein
VSGAPCVKTERDLVRALRATSRGCRDWQHRFSDRERGPQGAWNDGLSYGPPEASDRPQGAPWPAAGKGKRSRTHRRRQPLPALWGRQRRPEKAWSPDHDRSAASTEASTSRIAASTSHSLDHDRDPPQQPTTMIGALISLDLRQPSTRGVRVPAHGVQCHRFVSPPLSPRQSPHQSIRHFPINAAASSVTG